MPENFVYLLNYFVISNKIFRIYENLERRW